MDSKERRREQNRLAQRRFRGWDHFQAFRIHELTRIGILEKHSKRKTGYDSPDETKQSQSAQCPTPGSSTEAMNMSSSMFQWPYLAPNIISPQFDLSAMMVPHTSCASAASDDCWLATPGHHSPNNGEPFASLDERSIQRYLESCSWSNFEQALSNDDASTTTQASSPNETSRTSTLHVAVRKGNGRIVRLLLEYGANRNVEDAMGLTPLLQATTCGHEEIVEILLSHGASIELVDDQNRPALHRAILSRQERLLKRYLQHTKGNRSLVNSCDSEGKTALHLAVEAGLDAAVELLLDHDAELD